MKINIRLVLAQTTLALLFAASVMAQTWDTGLEVVNPQHMMVVIEELGGDARRLGLSEESIRAKVELQLRRYGIITTQNGVEGMAYFYVNINVAGEGPYGFSIRVNFTRHVFYVVGGKSYETMAVTWDRSLTGVVRENMQVVMSGIADIIDIFISNYLKANKMLVNPAETSLKSR